MSQNKVILLLGTNLGNKNKNLEEAKLYINKEIGIIKKESNILENEAEGFSSNNLFFNQKIEILTDLSPFDLLKTIKKIENNMGRIYSEPLKGEIYVDRIIDIDILYYNCIILESNILTIPHKQVYSREFVKSLIFF